MSVFLSRLYFPPVAEEWTAAVHVQRVWRGAIARLRARRQRQRNLNLHLAALRVQRAWYKRNKMFTAFLLMRCLVVKHEWEVEAAAEAASLVREAR